tara:strand:- start:264 stop:482 length:219 start_codon:yes stop_codon:yes gene_type:complete
MKYNTIDQYPVGTKVIRRNSGGASGSTGTVVEQPPEWWVIKETVRVKWNPGQNVSPVRTWVNIKFLEIVNDN